MNRTLVLVAWGGVGDAIICTPTIRALKENFPTHKIILYCPARKQWDVFKNNPYIDSLRILNVWSMMRYPYHLFAYKFNRKLINYTLLHFQFVAPSHIYDKSIKEIAADMFNIKLNNLNVDLFLSPEEELTAKKKISVYENVVIIHVHSRSSVNHHWSIEKWNQLVRELPEYSFIQIGFTDETAIEGAIDLRGKTTLREAFALLKYADSFVGIDSNFSHVTNAFNIPGVVLFGDSSPTIWGHDNNINIYKNLDCSPCYYYLWNQPCPYDHSCMDSISVSEVKEALKSQIRKKTKNSGNRDLF